LWSAQSSRAGDHFPDTDPIILPYTVRSNDDHDDKCSSDFARRHWSVLLAWIGY